MDVQQRSYYPKRFSSFQVTSSDDNGNPLVTVFYENNDFTGEVFRWTQTWNSDNICTSYVLTIAQ